MNDTSTLPSIAVLDDDDFQRQIIGSLVGQVGTWPALEFESASQALDGIEAAQGDVAAVICDLNMPGMDGMEFLRRLARIDRAPAVLIVSAEDSRLLRGVEAMAREYGLEVLGAMTKPLSASTLRTAMSKLKPGCWLRPPGGTLSDVPTERDVRRALHDGEFEPYFQPKVGLAASDICGVEVLVRWRHPVRGILPPSSFLGPVERAGLAGEFTSSLMEAAACRARAWSDAGLNLTININTFAIQLSDVRFPDELLALSRRHGLDPQALVIEVTESSALENVAQSLEVLSRLRIKGFGLSLDDFGTGYSSLQQLARIPFTELKIDRSFVTGAACVPHLRAMLEFTAGMARQLDVQMVGEGIETAEDWQCLREVGCDTGQGYFVARPMPGDAVLAWAEQWRRRGILPEPAARDRRAASDRRIATCGERSSDATWAKAPPP